MWHSLHIHWRLFKNLFGILFSYFINMVRYYIWFYLNNMMLSLCLHAVLLKSDLFSPYRIEDLIGPYYWSYSSELRMNFVPYSFTISTNQIACFKFQMKLSILSMVIAFCCYIFVLLRAWSLLKSKDQNFQISDTQYKYPLTRSGMGRYQMRK